jgi:hypothetical protein
MPTDWANLDRAFTLPSTVTDAKLRELYEYLRERLRQEAQAADLSVMQILQGERSIGLYIRGRQAEAAEYGQPGAFAHLSQEKDFWSAWDTAATRFTELVRRARPQGGGEGLTPAQVHSVFMAVLGQVGDEELRIALQDKFADALAGL